MFRSYAGLAMALVLALSLAACGQGGPAAAPAAAPATAAAAPVKVSLTWDKPVDMDLEVWSADGTAMIHRAFPGENWAASNCGVDVTNGGAAEYFTFTKVGEEDFSKGEYVISVYFAAREDESVANALATVTVTKADGTTEVRTRKVEWEQGKDQWHGFRIDAATGRIVEDLDQLISIQTTPTTPQGD